MKTPTCKECKGTGTIRIDGQFVSRPIDMTCWVCGGHAFKGWTRDQIAWYLLQFKTFEKLKSKSLRAGKPSDPLAYATIKQNINKACARLQIATQAVPRVKSTMHGTSDDELFLRNEITEYERRLTAIPIQMAKKAA